MLNYPHINPVVLQWGPLRVHWYGLMYVVGILGAWGLATLRIKKSQMEMTLEELSDLIFYLMVGILLGGRIGYILFYNGHSFLQNPLEMIKIWHGGMSFHGGLLGVIFAMMLFKKVHHFSFFKISDFIAPLVPIGLGAGRIGNFINGELWGRPTGLPWGMVFPEAGNIPRHPTQLYECFLEGPVLFFILWFYSRKPRPTMATSGLFLVGYGLFRFMIEWMREPDPQMGFIAFHWMTMGQLLSLPMFLVGCLFIKMAYDSPSSIPNPIKE